MIFSTTIASSRLRYIIPSFTTRHIHHPSSTSSIIHHPSSIIHHAHTPSSTSSSSSLRTIRQMSTKKQHDNPQSNTNIFLQFFKDIKAKIETDDGLKQALNELKKGKEETLKNLNKTKETIIQSTESIKESVKVKSTKDHPQSSHASSSQSSSTQSNPSPSSSSSAPIPSQSASKPTPASATEGSTTTSRMQSSLWTNLKSYFESAKQISDDFSKQTSKVVNEVKDNVKASEIYKTKEALEKEAKQKLDDSGVTKMVKNAQWRATLKSHEFKQNVKKDIETTIKGDKQRVIFKDEKEEEARKAREPKVEANDTVNDMVHVKSHMSAWDRYYEQLRNKAQKHPILRSVFGLGEGLAGRVRTASESLGDRVFGETEQSLAIQEVRERDPHFNLPSFMKEVETIVIPELLDAFLKGDMTVLKSRCSGQAYQAVFASIREREFQRVVVDPRILTMDMVELAASRVMENGPVFIITFMAHQVNCIRKKDNGEIIEGSPDDIQAVYYVIALQLDTLAPQLEWKVAELAMRGAVPTL